MLIRHSIDRILLSLHGGALSRFLQALGFATAIGVVVGLIAAASTEPDPYGYLIGAVLAAAVCIFSGIVGGGIYCLARWACYNSTRLGVIGGIAGFILTPIAWTALLIIPGGEPKTDGASLGMIYILLISILPAGTIGAIFGAGAGQK